MNAVPRVGMAWLRPTRRSIDWAPLVLVTCALLITEVVLGWRAIEVPSVVRLLGVAGLASATVLGLGDPAHSLLQALPTPPVVRLARRIVLLAGATGVAAILVVIGERVMDLSSPSGPDLAAALIALGMTGIAVHAVVGSMTGHGHEVAAAAVLLWAASAALPVPLVPEAARVAWLDNPGLVTAVAAAVVIGATRRRAA